MRSSHLILTVGLLTALGWTPRDVAAQQVTMGSPYHTLTDGFFEMNGVSWGGNFRGFNFSYGGGTLAQPAFGGFAAGAGLSTNFSILGPSGQINFGLNFSQGYRQSFTTQDPVITLMNGQTGFFSDTSQTPFVISVVPVVGAFPAVNEFAPTLPPAQFAEAAGMPMMVGNPRVQGMIRANADAAADAEAAREHPNRPRLVPAPPPAPAPAPPAENQAPEKDLNLAKPAARLAPDAPPPPAGPADRMAAAQASSAGRPAPSVAEARRMHQLEQGDGEEQWQALLERGRAAEDDGKPNVAKIYYQRVARHSTGEAKQQAQSRLDTLRGTATP